MKKFLGLLCLAAILAVVYLTAAQSRAEGKPVMDVIESEAGELAGQVKGMYQEYAPVALEQANDALGEAVEQADEAIGEAVESAVEGAKQGFLQSIKESVTSFFDGLSAEDD